jgi:hypothetical protein
VLADIYGAHLFDVVIERLRHFVLDSATGRAKKRVVPADQEEEEEEEEEDGFVPLTQLLELLAAPPPSSSAWQSVVMSKAGSHTARHLLALLADIRLKYAASASHTELLTHTTQLITRLCIELAPALPDLIHHVSASPFVQSLLSLLHLHRVRAPDALLPLSDDNARAATTREESDACDLIPPPPSDLYSVLVHRILTSPPLPCPSSSTTSTSNMTSCAVVTTQKHLTSSSSSPYVIRLMKAPIASHVLETIVSTCSDAFYLQLYQRYFRGRLAALCAHPIANFVVQRLIDSTRHLAHVRLLFAELCDQNQMRTLLAGRAGVVLKLVEVCARQSSTDSEAVQLQRDVVKALVAALVTPEYDTAHVRHNIVPILLHLSNTSPHTFKKKRVTKKQHHQQQQSSPSQQQQQQQQQQPLEGEATDENRRTALFSPIGSQMISALFHFHPTHAIFVVQR